jgi:hypothetical protein
MLTAPPTVDSAVLCARLAVLNDDPAPPAALVVELVDVIVVVWLRPDETLVAPAVTLSS